MTHYELTGETTTAFDGTVLQRIRALIDLPGHGVRTGDLGGFIADVENLSDHAWVSDHARVSGDARVSGGAQVYGGAQVSGDAWVYGDARVSGGARVSGDAWVYGDARVERSQDIMAVGPVGSESVTATLFRTAKGHALHVGCWTGTVEDLAAEVARRAQNWRCDQATTARYLAEYAALETLCRARISGWTA